MKRTIWMLSLLLAVATVTLTSCLGSDDNSVTTYPDTAITSFTLGTLNRYQHNTSKTTGKDTIVKITYTGSYYPMTIDHVGQKIYNMEPLPVGTDTKHVICTIGSKNNGVVYLKRINSDSLYYHQSTDSVDLSVPRTFCVFAVDGSGSREYTVTLNVSSTTGTTFGWVKQASIAPIADLASKHLIAFGDSVQLVDRNIVVMGERAFRLKDGLVESSTDLINWEVKTGETYTDQQLKCLIGASSFELFALGNDGHIKRSTDMGVNWQDEQLDESLSLLPLENIAVVSWPFASANDYDYVLLVGNDPQDAERMSIWRKLSPYQGQAQWVLMTQDDTNRQKLPSTTPLSLACYDNTVLAVGTGMKIYQSCDQGITWQHPSTLALPATAVGTIASMAVDKQGRLWLISDTGQLWEGSKR